jgi:hypothetical protein
MALAHYWLGLSSDPQAGIALAFLPIDVLVPIAVGGIVGRSLDRRREQRRVA